MLYTAVVMGLAAPSPAIESWHKAVMISFKPAAAGPHGQASATAARPRVRSTLAEYVGEEQEYVGPIYICVRTGQQLRKESVEPFSPYRF